jgi:multidrug efflux system outer membrane protein
VKGTRALGAAIGLLSACTLDPVYQRPQPAVAQDWNSSAPAGNPELAADTGWRDFFPDPRMQRLIALALANNRDLRIAALNVQEADAQYRIQRAGLFPVVSVLGEQEIEKTPGDVVASEAGKGAAGQGSNTAVISRFYSVGVGFTAYELDVFGKVRSLDRQALEQYLGYAETKRSTQISLVAQVASAYLVICADLATIRVTAETLKAQVQTYDLNHRSLDAGTTTAVALRQAEIAVDTARANLSSYQRQLAQDRNVLVQLLGLPLPGDVQFADGLDSAPEAADLAPGLPSRVLANRPDVLAAEHQLMAANANIGAARAAFFPSISLTANYGTASNQLSGLFKNGSTAWTFEPEITLPIFTAGANAAKLDLAKIQRNSYIAQYQKAIQAAFREVDDALAARATIDEQMTAQRALVVASGDAYQLAGLRFRSGVDSFLPVLDAQRTLYSSQLGLVSLELLRLQNTATLYKALGGGMKERTVQG